MELIIIGSFILTVLVIIIYYLIKNGFSRDTLKMILSKINHFRGLYFLIFWLYLCYIMMNAITGMERFVLLPFVSCGMSGILMLYKKTKEIGYKLFLISFIGGFGAFILLGLLSNYK